jgi:aldehyde:ferredoxin oxidoreductase
LLKPGVDPLSPDSPIVIGVGPLTGTILPGGPKIAATYKRPEFGHPTQEKHNVATAMGGCKRFGAMLKSSGYDHVIITGRAPNPSYLYIGSDGIKIHNASELWGKSIYDTTAVLASRHTKRCGGCGVWTMGPAGEKLVKISLAFVDQRGTLGRGGGGALLGSKNLKAVVTWGDKGIKVAEPKKFMELAERKRQEIINHPAFHLHPPPPFVGGHFTKNYPEEFYLETKVCGHACMGCLGPEFEVHQIKGGRFDGHIWPITPEPELAPMFGEKLQLSDYRDIMEVFRVIRGLGLDWVAFISMIPFLCRLYEKGVITAEDTDGVELKLGDLDRIVSMIDMIINRRGEIGKAAAEGWYPLAQKVGWEYVDDLELGHTIIKGMACQMDVEGWTLAPNRFSQLVFSKQQHHHSATHYGPMPAGIDAEEMKPFAQTFDGIKWDFANRWVTTWADFQKVFSEDNLNIGRYTKHAEDCKGVYNALAICDISPYHPHAGLKDPMRDIPFLAEVYSAATGLQISPFELKKRGEALWNLDRMINAREGFSREDESIPKRWEKNTETPCKSFFSMGTEKRYLTDWFGHKLKREDLSKILDEYYDERGWNIATGLPDKKKLIELGLEEFTLG